MKKQDLLIQVRHVFSDYLEQHHQRKTSERFAILDEIYSRNDHFDAESLYLEMKRKDFNVSRATVYNTLELLQECELVKRHQFGNNIALFEKSYGNRQHDHLICVDCNKVVEFCDPRIHQITTQMGDLLHFDIPHHSLILYGRCHGCELKEQEKFPNKQVKVHEEETSNRKHLTAKNKLRNAV